MKTLSNLDSPSSSRVRRQAVLALVQMGPRICGGDGRGRTVLGAALALFIAACSQAPSKLTLTTPPHGVIGVHDAQLDAEYWVKRAPNAQRIVLNETQIETQNARLTQVDPSMRDLERLPATLEADAVRQMITALSTRPRAPIYDERGVEITAPTLGAILAASNLNAIPASQATRFGMVVRRADLRTHPTTLRVFSSPDNADIDRFQESALFPGAPVAIVHESADGEWWFVLSHSYAAWVEKRFVAEGARDAIFGYARKEPYVVVTGATARTVFTRERPEVSELQLDMGVRAPLLSEWSANQTVNGQHPYAAHVIELPLRRDDGSLAFTPALLPKSADVSTDYLPLNRANLLRQSFKFLGERYGWGHSYNARDCSGFVSEVYRSFGVQLPRNTGDQSASPALTRITLGKQDDRAARLKILRSLQIGDLVYVPRHVMMVIGHDNGSPYVIHDTTGLTYRDAEGRITSIPLNGVSVTPLLLDEGQPMIDAIHTIVRIRP